MNTVSSFCVRDGREKKWKSHTQNQDPQKGLILRRRTWAPTVGAQIVGAKLCPILAPEIGDAFQAREQAREKHGIEHRKEKTFVYTCRCFLTGDVMHHTWSFQISGYHIDFVCVRACLPPLPPAYVPAAENVSRHCHDFRGKIIVRLEEMYMNAVK